MGVTEATAEIPVLRKEQQVAAAYQACQLLFFRWLVALH